MPKLHPWVSSAALLLFLLPGITLAQTTKAPYTVMELPFKPLYISNSGEVVGTTEDHRAVAWSHKDGLKLLPGLKPFARAEARGSASGTIVGFASLTHNSTPRAFQYNAGRLRWLQGENSRALAINHAGMVAGDSAVKGKKTIQPVIWQNGSPSDLGGCCGGTARALNSSGQVVGDLYDEQGRYRPFLWDRTRDLKFLVPPGAYGSAIAINDAGHVLLQQREKGIVLYYSDSRQLRLEAPNELPADGRAINDSDMVVGAFGAYFDDDRAFLWDEKNGFRDLNQMIPRDAGWKLQYATGINDRGEIVGVGDHGRRDDAGFLLLEQEPAK